MSTPVTSQASVANYVSSDVPTSTGSSASQGPDAATVASVQAWEKQQQKEARDELQRGIVDNMGQSYVESDDDEDSKAAKHSVKQGAQKAGVLVTDKGLRTMDQATKADPATRKLVDKLKDPNDADTQQLQSDLQGGKTPDLSFMQKAYADSPAATLSADGSQTGTAGQSVPRDVQAKTGDVGASGDAPSTTAAASKGFAAVAGAGTGASAAAGTTGAANASTTNGAPVAADTSAANTTAADGTATAASSTASTTSLNTPGMTHLTGGSWSTYVAMAMYNSTKELQVEKKSELNQIKKYNSMLDAVNAYVSNVLMPAQQELQSRVAKTKDKDKASSLEVTIYSPLRNIDTSDCDRDASGSAVLIQKPGTTDPPVAEKVTQTSLTSMIGEADQWRTSISNNQQLHSSNYQSLDTQVTSNLNMITALFKNVNETQTGIVRNLPT